jgi:hypothetical protein
MLALSRLSIYTVRVGSYSGTLLGQLLTDAVDLRVEVCDGFLGTHLVQDKPSEVHVLHLIARLQTSLGRTHKGRF